MPITRKKVNKIVYKNEDSESEGAADFTDSGSEAHISDDSNSDEEAEEVDSEASSIDDFDKKSKKRITKSITTKKPKFVKAFINKIKKQIPASSENEITDATPTLFSVKDLTDSDKLLPSVLNLSESDSSEDEFTEVPTKNTIQTTFTCGLNKDSDTDVEADVEYKDVWVNNIQDNSEEIAKKTFLELEQHKTKIEEVKASVQNYLVKEGIGQQSDVKDLLAQGEEVLPQQIQKSNKKSKSSKYKDDSDAEMEDWEEVKETKAIPQQGLQLVVDFPDAACRKKKKLDIEMMMKRKINRVKKEYQVYMHKVHVLCWLAHGNYVSHVLNDQEVLANALSLVPSKECYPGERVDMKYVEQITIWYKDKFTLKQDKNEEKFRPKAPPLKDILLAQIKRRVVTTQKYFVIIFVSMLRALGLQCRLVFNFVTLPIKPSSSELCSLSTKLNNENKCDKNVTIKKENKKKSINRNKPNTSENKGKISQLDGIYDETFDSESDFENIMQVDGNDDIETTRTRRTRSNKINTANENEDVSPPKRLKIIENTTYVKQESKNQKNISSQKRRSNKSSEKTSESQKESNKNDVSNKHSSKPLGRCRNISKNNLTTNTINKSGESPSKQSTTRHSARSVKDMNGDDKKLENNTSNSSNNKIDLRKTTDSNEQNISSSYFESKDKPGGFKKRNLSRKRTLTSNPSTSQNNNLETTTKTDVKPKTRTKSAPVSVDEKSKYFNGSTGKGKPKKVTSSATNSNKINKSIRDSEDSQRVTHRDLLLKSKTKVTKNDVTSDLVNIIKKRVKEAKQESKKGLVKGKLKEQSDEDSDYLPVESPIIHEQDSDDDFKPTKLTPKPSTSRKIDRRVLSSDEENTKRNKTDVWCEIFVEELEQWIAVDVIKGRVHCTNEIYNRATHPVTYIVGWDNNNYLKDLTRRYVPHWNTVTRKQRAEPMWWEKAVRPWLGPRTAKDKEEDESLDRMQLEAPLPKSIAEYKNHPLYALKRHLLKFEAIYPPDAATLGFVRGEPVYARECVHTCRSRDTWLKEAKVVRLGEQPYKIVKARPKWDKLSNRLITDKPLEVFGSWQVQDYEPPEAENGIVPRNAYGNVELFKDCMLPKGTVHIKLPGLIKVARKLNIDCAPAMTGFEFNGGWSHPVYDGFVVCKEFEEIVTEAWIKDQEEQERKEIEKMEARVYGNWKRLIRGLLIRERLKIKYGFEDPSTSQTTKKLKGPRLIIKKKT